MITFYSLKTLKIEVFEQMEKNIAVTVLSKLERIFVPAFFDVKKEVLEQMEKNIAVIQYIYLLMFWFAKCLN